MTTSAPPSTAIDLPGELLDALDTLDEPALLLDAADPQEVRWANRSARAEPSAAWIDGLGEEPYTREALYERLRNAGTDTDRIDWPWATRAGTRWGELRFRRIHLKNQPWVFVTVHDAEGWIPRAFDDAAFGLALLTDDLRFVRVNPALSRMLGRPEQELIGACWADLARADGEDVARCSRADGTEVWVRATLGVVRDDQRGRLRLAHYEDVTGERARDQERRTLEAQLRRAQRMEPLARLAGGIAHDFNNMLSIILNYADFARRISPDGRARDYLDAIRKGALRAAALTRQLLVFGRRDTTGAAPLDLNHVVSDLERLLRRTLGEDVEMTVSLDPEAPPVWMAVSHAEQIVMNLVVNARDAMPTGGALRVTTEVVHVDEEEAAWHVGARSGRYVRLTVQDTGIGMSEEVLALAFDPFFTTKERTEGSGLGLSIVYGIVHEAGGWIDVSTASGVGTTMRMMLPESPLPLEIKVEEPGVLTLGRGESVLVVEDEPAVRALTVQILRESNYLVEDAATPEAALDLCRRRGRPFDLLLTDVIMPRMSGADLANLIRATWRTTRVLFMSGYPGERLDPYRAQHADVVLLQKPFPGDELLHAVRRILDER